MKTTKLALGILFALSAMSQAGATDVTVYGVVDTYVAVNNDSGTISSGVQSGGANASLFGFKGSETINATLNAIFKLEGGVLVDDGTSAPPGGGSGYLFQRESWVGLQSETGGRLTVGRQYTPHFMTFIFTDPTAMSLGGAIGNFCWPGHDSLLGGAYTPADLARRDNSILYASPEWSGFSFELFGALGETQKADHSPSGTLGNTYNVALQYRQGPLFVRTSVLTESLTKGDFRRTEDTYWATGLTYDLGVTKPSILFVKKFSRDTEMSPDVWALQLGASTPLAGGNLMTSAAFFKNQSADKADAWSLGVRYDYPLSQRTKLYAGVAAVINESHSAKAVVPGGGSSPAFAVTAAGNDQQQVFVGVSHAF